MRAGQLRHRIAILERTYPTTDSDHSTSLDEYGERKAGWQTAEEGRTERWARVTPLSGRELFEARQVHSETTHQIELRGGTAVSPGTRVEFGTRQFEVVSSIDGSDERGISTILMAKERVA